jgi:hypothetical protein
MNVEVIPGDYWNTGRINRKGKDLLMDFEII